MKKNLRSISKAGLFMLIISIIFSVNAYPIIGSQQSSQSEWEGMEQMPGYARPEARAIALGSKIYVMEKHRPEPEDDLSYRETDLLEYNTETQTWTQKQKASMLSGYTNSDLIIHKGELCYLTLFEAKYNWHEYKPSNDEWTTREFEPANVSSYKQNIRAASYGDNVYIFDTSTYLANNNRKVETYNPETHQYKEVTGTIPSRINKIYSVHTYKNKIYALCKKSQWLGIEIYDPVNNTWTEKSISSTIPNGSFRINTTLYDGKIFFSVPAQDETTTGTVLYYNIHTDGFDGIAKAGFSGASSALAVVNEYIYKIGGLYQGNVSSALAERYYLPKSELAAELKQDVPRTVNVTGNNQEDLFYFNLQDGIAYEIYTTGDIDTIGSIHGINGNRFEEKDGGKEGQNFEIVRSYWGKTYLKVIAKNVGSGSYQVVIKKRFAVPEVSYTQTENDVTLTWTPIEKAKQYKIVMRTRNVNYSPYISEVVVPSSQTEYVYSFTDETRDKILTFTVEPMHNGDIAGECSKMVYTKDIGSPWEYVSDMPGKKGQFTSAVIGKKIYTFGGNSNQKGLEEYNTETGEWKVKSEYPRAEIHSVTRASMEAVGEKLYIMGGANGDQGDWLPYVYEYDPEKNEWTEKKEMPVASQEMSTAVCNGKIYVFGGNGRGTRIDVFDPVENTWTKKSNLNAVSIWNAVTVNGEIHVLVKKYMNNEEKFLYALYNDKADTWEYTNKQEEWCPEPKAYTQAAAFNGRIYMKDKHFSKSVMLYDVYSGKWSKLKDTNLLKEASGIECVNGTIYSFGGIHDQHGALNVVEKYETGFQSFERDINIEKDERYQLNLTGENLINSVNKRFTLMVDTDKLDIIQNSSLMTALQGVKGVNDLKLVKFSAKLGLVCFTVDKTIPDSKRWKGVMNSIPVKALTDDDTAKVTVFVENE